MNPRNLRLSAKDQRQHLYIIGKTDSGKTTLLRNLILQHIALGHGVGLIDPHGDLAEELLNHIPPCRADHLVYFNPGDLEFPVGLNVIGNVAPDDRHLVASGIESAYLRGTLAGSVERTNAPALPEGYTKNMKAIAEKQAALAGYRLADEIRNYVSP